METETIPIASIAEAGAANDGSFVQLTLKTDAGEIMPLSFPHMLVPKLLAAIQDGTGMAAKDRAKKFGSEDAADEALGVKPFVVAEYRLAIGRSKDSGASEVILQIVTPEKFSIHIALPQMLADQLADKLKVQAGDTQLTSPRQLN